MRYGIGLGNVAGSNDPARLALTNAASFVALHYQASDLRKVLDTVPNSRGVVRWFCTNLLSQTDAYVVNQIQRILWDNSWITEIIVGNELNLVSEQNPVLSPEATASKLKSLFTALKTAMPKTTFHLGAFSPGLSNYFDYYRAVRDANIPFDIIDVHCYGTTYGSLILPLLNVKGLFPNSYTDITEWNWGAGSTIDYAQFEPEAAKFLEKASSIAISANWFMWKWDYHQTGTSVDILDTGWESHITNLYKKVYSMPDISTSVPLVASFTQANGGPRSETRNIFIHSTRSGQPNTLDDEAKATVGYFMIPGGDSAHAVVGPTVSARLVHDSDIAYHAKENNKWALGIEIAQPFVDTPYQDSQYRRAAEICARWCEKYHIPPNRVFSQTQSGIIGHEDSEQGKRDGKSDPGPMFDWTKFISMVKSFMVPQPIPPAPNSLTLGPGFAHICEANNFTPLTNEQYVDWGSVAVARDNATGGLVVLAWRKFTNESLYFKWSDGHN